jgi:hypothetical protein
MLNDSLFEKSGFWHSVGWKGPAGNTIGVQFSHSFGCQKYINLTFPYF